MNAFTLPSRFRTLAAAIATAMVLAACGGSPPPIPPPAPTTGSGSLGSAGTCIAASGAYPLWSSAITGTLTTQSGGGGTISMNLFYQNTNSIYAGQGAAPIVGTANLYLPQLTQGFTTNASATGTSTLCVSTTTTNGQVTNGLYLNSQVQLTMYGTYPLYFTSNGLSLSPTGQLVAQGAVQAALQGYIQNGHFTGAIQLQMQNLGNLFMQSY